MKTFMMTTLVLGGALALGAKPVFAHGCGSGCGQLAMARRPATTVAGHAGHDAKTAEAEHKEASVLKPQSICPVMGLAIDRDLYVDHEGKRIYVCCAGCIEAVKAAPEAAIAKLAEKGEAPAQALCPIMGAAIDPNQFVDHDGKRIFVCCPGCINAVKADPEGALEKLREQGVAPAKAEEAPATPRTHQHHH